MATTKFHDPSPYKKTHGPPQEDYLYEKYLNDISCKNATNTDPILKLALFGAGRAGTIHLSNIIGNRRTKLLYIVDENQPNWSKLQKYWGLDDVTFLPSNQADKVYKDPNVDAVVVATPTYAHEEIVVKSLTAKKAVFCEKPIAEQFSETVKCYQMAKKVGKPLFCAFNRRFDPSYSVVRDRVRNGEVGHVHTIKTVSRDSPLPTIDYLKTSGGIFHDCMVHDIDMITWILGEYPTRVAVQAQANIPEIKAINDFDTIAAVLYFKSGTLGMIDLSRYSCFGYDQRLEVFGPRGMVSAANEQPIHCVTSQYGLQGINNPPIWYSFPSRFRLGYVREFEHFLDVALGKATSSVHGTECLAVSRIASACEESARTGKMVEINWDDLLNMRLD